MSETVFVLSFEYDVKSTPYSLPAPTLHQTAKSINTSKTTPFRLSLSLCLESYCHLIFDLVRYRWQLLCLAILKWFSSEDYAHTLQSGVLALGHCRASRRRQLSQGQAKQEGKPQGSSLESWPITSQARPLPHNQLMKLHTECWTKHKNTSLKPRMALLESPADLSTDLTWAWLKFHTY